MRKEVFRTFLEARTWAKKNPGVIITKAPDGQGYIGGLQFAFACDKKWSHLAITSNENVRHCLGCRKDVYLCQTDTELEESTRLNRCIAVDSNGPTQIKEDTEHELLLGELPSWF